MRLIKCRLCGGKGERPYKYGGAIECNQCRGTGKTAAPQDNSKGGW